MSAEQQAPAPVEAPNAPAITYHVEGSKGTRFPITAKAVEQSKTLSDLILNLGSGDDQSIPLSNIKDQILEKIVQWCEHHKEDEPEVGNSDESVPKQINIPQWDQEFLNGLDNEELFDLIVAANYLDIKVLMNYSCKVVANMVKGKSPEEMRIIFAIPTDEEDEERERREGTAATASTSTQIP